MQTKFTILAILILVLLQRTQTVNMTFSEYYTSYATICGKNYSASQNTTRQGYYNTATAQIDTLNSQSLTYVAGVNCFTDWSSDQLRSLTQGVKTLSQPSSDDFTQFQSLSTNDVNWKTDGSTVTSVQDQQGCGGSWAFSVVGMCQSSLILKQSLTQNLAQQFSIQCTTSSSCDGGYIEYALQAIVYEGGIPLQSEFPYDSEQSYSGICSGGDTKTYISPSLYHFYNLTDSQLIKLLSRGPLVVSVSSQGWQYYESGIFECSSTASIDHAVLLVGVTSQKWIAKNSWGINWGDFGYIEISRSANKNCGIGYSAHLLYENGLSYKILLFVCLWIMIFM